MDLNPDRIITSRPELGGIVSRTLDPDGAWQYETGSGLLVQVWQAAPGRVQFSVHDADG